ncbi:hypothetical protein JKG47_15790 [Acidithiobacillus sp. MC6.1]|nr:hypothetical protein [Acidithiobacillus sp. MC6.1]
MRIVFCGQVPKDPNYPEATEDAVEIAQDVGRLAISDGASESFDSKTLARLIVEGFVRYPELTSEWLSGIQRQYGECYDLSELSWSKHAAFERGSFATLLGLKISPTKVDVLSVGDSLAVLLSDTKMIDSFPYGDPQQFQQRPDLFCTNPSLNGFIEEPDFFPRHQKTWCLDGLERPVVLCMTDALGEWAFRMAQEDKPQWANLLSIADEEQLRYIVYAERQHRRMRVDDVTLVSIAFDEVTHSDLSHS